MSNNPNAVLNSRIEHEVKPKTAIYCRTAANDGKSIIAQERELREFAAAQMLDVGLIYCDNGVSGLALNRAAFRTMMLAVENGEINCIIVRDYARVSRTLIQLWDWLIEMHRINVRVIAVKDGFDSGHLGGELHEKLSKALKKAYNDELSKKTKAGIARKKELAVSK
ncbi:MAG: recombinase family protein [Oscillospiraceae bacterium]|jgi:DNA invertase Pin-like site-specific DNA recombinase|nr:recombinase family protein [Oscillospiraceae bacterium]